MVCIDIDGTLINSSHQVTKKTIDVLSKLSKQNILVVLVSARPTESVKSLVYNKLKLTMPFIAFNGGIVSNKGKLLEIGTIDNSIAEEVYKDLLNEGISINIYNSSDWYIPEMDDYVKKEIEIVNINPKILHLENRSENRLSSINQIVKILGLGEEEKIKTLECDYQKKYGDVLTVYRSKPTYLEIVNNNVSKTKAINILQELYGIRQCEVLAIGDNYNDIDMLTYAGLGIAMGNAPKKVKSCADDITGTNDEDGVANALMKYFN